jgi:hypothetical protein
MSAERPGANQPATALQVKGWCAALVTLAGPAASKRYAHLLRVGELLITRPGMR